jgi:hypothetical protein
MKIQHFYIRWNYHKNTKKKEKNGEMFIHEKRGDPIPEIVAGAG